MTSTEVIPPVTRSRGTGFMAVAAAIYLVLRNVDSQPFNDLATKYR